jgi:hypothetical protein
MPDLSKDRGSLSGEALLNDQARRLDESNARMSRAFALLFNANRAIEAAQPAVEAANNQMKEAQAEWSATIAERETLTFEMNGLTPPVGQWIAGETVEINANENTQLGESEQ